MSIKKVGTYGSISEASEFGQNVAQYIDCGKLKKENYMYPLFSTHKTLCLTGGKMPAIWGMIWPKYLYGFSREERENVILVLKFPTVSE